jgi:hypothetical protein
VTQSWRIFGSCRIGKRLRIGRGSRAGSDGGPLGEDVGAGLQTIVYLGVLHDAGDGSTEPVTVPRHSLGMARPAAGKVALDTSTER